MWSVRGAFDADILVVWGLVGALLNLLLLHGLHLRVSERLLNAFVFLQELLVFVDLLIVALQTVVAHDVVFPGGVVGLGLAFQAL